MKIASATVRRLRTGRGWSQEQLATASGLSLRTIQRVEAEGAAAMATRVCLAATFNVPLAELAEAPEPVAASRAAPAPQLRYLYIGVAVIACALIVESGRLPGLALSTGLASIDALLVVVGALLAVPAAVKLIMQRRLATVVLATIGTPPVTLALGALLVAAMTGRVPAWPFVAFGIGGAALLAMALRDVRLPSMAAGDPPPGTPSLRDAA
jgi:transcriptional regulator with XRE-family HTH domain